MGVSGSSVAITSMSFVVAVSVTGVLGKERGRGSVCVCGGGGGGGGGSGEKRRGVGERGSVGERVRKTQ